MFKIRAVQLDLARQMETVEYIYDFIELISKFAHNTLFLYLEGRIRTESFDGLPPGESYSPHEMKKVVGYAGSKGIQVIPIISTLGHCEQFLNSAKLGHLAELRDSSEGRFSDFKHVCCPSLDETYSFFGKYLAEVSEIFPSEYFHAGCDESWDIGYCPLCAARIRQGESQGAIFAEHIRKSYGIIAGKLKKKMLMWDDMFENYPQALDRIPRDIILCCWQYGGLVDIPRAHFRNRRKIDELALYDKKGFQYLFCPADKVLRNIETYTDYANKYKALGGLLTIWGKDKVSMIETYPAIALAGNLWSGKYDDPETALNKSQKSLFGISARLFLDAVKQIKNLGQLRENINPEDFLQGPLSELEYERLKSLNTLEPVLKFFKGKASSSLGNDIIDDMLIYLRRASLQLRLREIVPAFFAPTAETPAAINRAQLDDCIDELKSIRQQRKIQRNKYRRGIKPDAAGNFYGKFEKNLRLARNGKKRYALLTVDFFLPDMYSAQKTAFYIKFKSKKEFIKLKEKVFKPCRDNTPYYTFSIPFPSDSIPEIVKIESHGYGGQGFTFLEIHTRQGVFTPKSLLKTEGIVVNPENILIDDLRWCFLGETDVNKSFLNPKSAKRKSRLEISVGKETENLTAQ
ncbi:MAG: family 20 glycosylhydrolase [Kiritimatiellia bacterium]|nr:family 20 glycosylhydrolase [Kiritimatiellia bacterium]